MKTFYIIANSDKEESRKLSYEIADYLTEHGQRCLIRRSGESGSAEDYEPPIGPDVDGILVLGGDGTLLRAARNLSDRNIPFLGVNLGHLGYLAEIELQGLGAALDRLIASEYTVENRMMLRGNVCVNGEIAERDVALNDIALNRMGTLRVIDYEVFVNDEYLNSFTADGLIVSTPTGSTGYSLSAGGPIVSPTAEMLILTPICPHTLNSRSIVFSGEDRIRVEIGKGRRGGDDEAFVTFDGDHYVRLRTGDFVEIGKSSRITKILKISQASFLEALRDKLSR
ncbi:MAG: NAD(+)/NADH kinase [Lachnospiraceae bacterium]|nr:NAD(+)/NADH kinase [Lachnospiraceae bacterium]